MMTILSRHEYVRFTAFCGIEMALGVYFPSMEMLKSRVVNEAAPGRIYELMRMPLNAFVMGILCTAGEGKW